MSPTEFKAAVEKIIGIPPNRPSGEPFWWMLDTPSARLGVEIDGSRILMNFYDDLPGLGENPATGQWNINGRDFNDDPEAMLRELARRLAKAGYVPPMPDQEMPDLAASIGHEVSFRATFRLRNELVGDPIAEMAFEYAATHKLKPYEMAYIGAAVVRKDQPQPQPDAASFKMRTLDGDLSDAIYDQLVMGNAPGPAPEGAVTLVCLGDLYADSCSVCGKRAEWGIASQSGPHGCTEAIKAGRCFCDDHLPKVTREPSDKPTPPEPCGTPETDASSFVWRVPVQVGLNGVAFTDAEVTPSWVSRKLERERNEALRRAEALDSALAEAGRDFVRVWNEADGSETPEANRIEVRHVAETAKDKIKAALAPGTTKEAEQ